MSQAARDIPIKPQTAQDLIRTLGVSSVPTACTHDAQEAAVQVVRTMLFNQPRFVVELAIRCSHCGVAFRFPEGERHVVPLVVPGPA